MNKRVVVTGIGAISPIGTGKENFWNALREGVVGTDKLLVLMHRITQHKLLLK